MFDLQALRLSQTTCPCIYVFGKVVLCSLVDRVTSEARFVLQGCDSINYKSRPEMDGASPDDRTEAFDDLTSPVRRRARRHRLIAVVVQPWTLTPLYE
jgi:hypothetical protein